MSLPALEAFYDEGWIADVLHPVKSGKEATVYCCRATSRTGTELLAAKVYHDRQVRNFKNDAVYQQGRVIQDKRQRRAFARKSATGREVQFASWIEHEYATLCLLYDAGADVPRPITRSSSAILMDYVGGIHEPAPLLTSVSLDADEARFLFHRVLRNVELWLACNRVHGDLSPFNILYWQGSVRIIDFPQAIDPRFNSSAYELLARDIENVWRYFARCGVRADPSRLVTDLWRRFMRAEL